MNGVVVGGWEFVWAADGLTVTGFAIYTASLVARLRKVKSS